MRQLTTTDLREALTVRLKESGISLNPGDADAIINVTVRHFINAHPSTPEAQRRLDRNLLNSNIVYAIPDDALELFPSLVSAGICALMEGPHAALADLVALLFRYRCLRVELNAEEAAILTVLKQAKSEMQPPLSEANIRDALKRERLILKRPLTEALASLKSKRTDRATLVLENGGRWAIGSV